MQTTKAYITLLSNSRYLMGVIGLFRSLQRVHSEYPLYCLISKNAESGLCEILENTGIRFIVLEDSTVSDTSGLNLNGYGHWSNTFDKLRIWGLTQFEKLVFLDADMIVRNNLDHLFDCKPFSAAVAGGKLFGWTKLNSGLMVIEPDPEVEKELIRLTPIVIEEFSKEGRSVGDQDVIQRYCSNWEYEPELHLDESYNMVADWIKIYVSKFEYSWENNSKPINVVHFIGHTKPWTPKTMREKIWMLKTIIRNPYYLLAFMDFQSLTKKDRKSQIR